MSKEIRAVRSSRAYLAGLLALMLGVAACATRDTDVTRDAVISVSDIEVAGIDSTTVASLRRGESAVLVRYEGRYATAPITVMGDRAGFAWKATAEHNFIDAKVDQRLQRLKILPADLCTDAEFVRRLYLDLTGRPPTPAAARRFVNGKGEQQAKRRALIDELIGSPAFVDHWANKWADLLQCNSETLGEKGVWVFREEFPDIDVFAPIHVGNNVFIGARSTILPGASIGDNCVVGACSLVTGTIPPNCVVAGVPARVIRPLDSYRARVMGKAMHIRTSSPDEKERLLRERFGLARESLHGEEPGSSPS